MRTLFRHCGFLLLVVVLFGLRPTVVWAGSSIVDDLWSAASRGHVAMILDDGTPLTRERLEKCLKVKDVTNGYLKIECDAFVNTYESVIFKRKDGRRLLVVIQDGVSVENRGYLEFDEEAKDWVNVQSRVLPEFKNDFLKRAYERVFKNRGDISTLLFQSAHSSYRTSLPRKGTTITIQSGLGLDLDEGRKPLFHLSWNKKSGRFRIVEPSSR
jgi:hypothetical protein